MSRAYSPKQTFPASERLTPVIQLKKVVLPAPLGPIRPTISDLPTLKLILLKAFIPPKRLLRPLTSNIIASGPPTTPHLLPGARVRSQALILPGSALLPVNLEA